MADLYRSRGLVVGMCGDGGNDCGGKPFALACVVAQEEAQVAAPESR